METKARTHKDNQISNLVEIVEAVTIANTVKVEPVNCGQSHPKRLYPIIPIIPPVSIGQARAR